MAWIFLNIAGLMAGAAGAGWAMSLLIRGGLSFAQVGFCIAGAWAGLALMLLAMVGIARMEP